MITLVFIFSLKETRRFRGTYALKIKLNSIFS